MCVLCVCVCTRMGVCVDRMCVECVLSVWVCVLRVSAS